jgi:predicted DNA-binding ribbon-helix-helix protein
MRCYNAAMSDSPSIEDLIARLAKLDDERAKLLNESRIVREQILRLLARRKEKPTDAPPKSP